MKNRPYYCLSSLIFLSLLLTACGNSAATETTLQIATEAPAVIPLPNGFQPEGIAAGKGTTFYVGSIPTGAIYRGDLQTGKGDVLVQPQKGRQAIGLKYDNRTGYLFVAGGVQDMPMSIMARQAKTFPRFSSQLPFALSMM